MLPDGVQIPVICFSLSVLAYSRAYPDGTVKKYVVKGMKYTGWDDEMKEYNDFVNEKKFK